MKTLIAILLLTATAFGQEGLDTNIGTGRLPEGIVGVTDIDQVQLSRIEAIKGNVQALQVRYGSGSDDPHHFFQAQIELALAQLDTTDGEHERLDYSQAAFTSALLAWQRVKELQMVNMSGGDEATETQSRADVYRFRVLWLKENAKSESTRGGSPGQNGLDSEIGTGRFPEGLVGISDISKLQLLRVESLKSAVAALQARYESGLESIDLLLKAHEELALAQLDTTDNKQERLDYIQAALNRALLSWQRVKELQKVGMRGGDYAAETQARAAVFLFRVMWLKEKASAESSPMPQSLGAASSGPNVLPSANIADTQSPSATPVYCQPRCVATRPRVQRLAIQWKSTRSKGAYGLRR